MGLKLSYFEDKFLIPQDFMKTKLVFLALPLTIDRNNFSLTSREFNKNCNFLNKFQNNELVKAAQCINYLKVAIL